MVSNEDLYKRAEDQKWRESVNDRIVNLTSGEVVQNDRLDDLDTEIEALRTVIEGKPDDRNDNGLKGDILELSRGLNALRALMAPDQLGEGGVLNRLKRLEKKAGLEEKNIEGRWRFRAAVAVAIVSLIGLVLTNLDRIEPSLKRFWNRTVAEESTPPKKPTAKTSKAKRRRPPPPELTPKGVVNEPATDEVPE